MKNIFPKIYIFYNFNSDIKNMFGRKYIEIYTEIYRYEHLSSKSSLRLIYQSYDIWFQKQILHLMFTDNVFLQ